MKPLNQKAYGHIGHLPGSRMGPGDHHCHEGQARIATEKARDRHDVIVVQEKVDGSCCAVAMINGTAVALGRAGYLAETSKYEQHQFFAQWVQANAARFAGVLNDGERLVGEWMAQAHGTRYELPHEPFIAFDLMRGARREPYSIFYERAGGSFVTPRLIHVGGPMSIADAMLAVESSGHGAVDPVEGCVWRVERKREVDFLCKYVRPDKVDGRYLPEMTGHEPVWHWRP